MRVPRLISEFLEWRWAPCVGLTAGSLSFVALSLLLIPTQIGGSPTVADRWQMNPASMASPPRALFGASLVGASSNSLTQPGLGAAPSPEPEALPNREQAMAMPQARGFSPIADRGQAPSPESEPPAAPDSTRMQVQQPEPGGPAREVTNP